MYENLKTSDRVHLIYCDIGNYRHWVKDSTSPEKFFTNFDKLIASLEELTSIDYEFLEPAPSSEINELKENEQKYYQAFLARYWSKISYEISKLKTDKGKKNKSDKFYLSLNPYEDRFSDETLNMIKNSDFSKVDVDYANTHISKTDHDLYFVFETDKRIKSLISADTICSAGCNQDDYMYNIENKFGNYAWFYQNRYILKSLMCEEISDDIIYSLILLLLIEYDNEKGSRYLSIKYNLERKYAKKLYLCADRIVWKRRDYLELQKRYQNDPNYYNKYIISTHSSACEKCQQHRGKIYNIKDAVLTKNFPPFCHRGCSRAELYIPNSTPIPEPFTIDKKFFAKAFNLFEDECYEEAAEYGLKAYNLVPESHRYIQYVPEMLVKAGQTEKAVEILKEYLENYEPDPHLIKDFEKYSKRLEREKKKISK